MTEGTSASPVAQATDDGRLRELQMFYDIARAVNSNLALPRVLQSIVESIGQFTPWKRSSIVMVNSEAGYTETLARFPPSDNNNRQTWPLSTSSTMRALQGDCLLVPDALAQDEFPGLREHARTEGYRSVMIVPLQLEEPKCAVWFYGETPHTFTEHEIQQARTIADQVAVAIRNARLYQAERETAAKFERLLRLQTELLERVLRGDPLDAITQVVADAIRNPIMVVDRFMHCLAESSVPLADADAEAQWTQFVTQVRQEGDIRRTLTSLVPTNIDNHADHIMLDADAIPDVIPARVLVRPLGAGRQTLGYLLLLELTQPFDSLTEAISREAGLAIGIELMRRRSVFSTESRLKSDVLRKLFAGEAASRAEILERSSYLGVDLEAENGLLLVKLPRARVQSADDAPDLEQVLLHLSPALAAQFPGAAAVRDENDLVILGPAAKLENIAQWTARLVERLVGSTPLVVVGPTCRHIEDYRRARSECDRALQICTLLQKTGVVPLSKLGGYRFLISVDNSTLLQEFIDQMLGPILAYDEKRGTQLIRTLQAYFQHNCSLEQTANDLFVHVSTLRYRLQRIEELSDLQLSDAETRFALQLALRLLALYRPGYAP